MHNPVTVELVRRQVPADPDTVQQRTDLVERLRNLGQLEVDDGQIGDTVTGWSARINGVEFPVDAYGLEEVNGRVLVSLVVEATSVQIGDPTPAGAQVPPGSEDKPKVTAWGAPGVPDPRESIAGWKPEPQVHIDYTGANIVTDHLREAVQIGLLGRGMRA